MGFIKRNVIYNYKVTKFWYVDDCFVSGENEKAIDDFFSVFNKTHSSITFTLEKENNDELAFLDLLVKRQNNQFLTSVYRKQTFTGEYLNFHSFCSMKKISDKVALPLSI